MALTDCDIQQKQLAVQCCIMVSSPHFRGECRDFDIDFQRGVQIKFKLKGGAKFTGGGEVGGERKGLKKLNVELTNFLGVKNIIHV